METIIGMNGDSGNLCIGMNGNPCIGMSERWGFQAVFCKP
jgi:hypothetical protein